MTHVAHRFLAEMNPVQFEMNAEMPWDRLCLEALTEDNSPVVRSSVEPETVDGLVAILPAYTLAEGVVKQKRHLDLPKLKCRYPVAAFSDHSDLKVDAVRCHRA